MPEWVGNLPEWVGFCYAPILRAHSYSLTLTYLQLKLAKYVSFHSQKQKATGTANCYIDTLLVCLANQFWTNCHNYELFKDSRKLKLLLLSLFQCSHIDGLYFNLNQLPSDNAITQ